VSQLPPKTQRVVPYLFYKNGRAAIDFIAKAFGFEVRFVLPGPGDSIGHAELGLGDNAIYLGTPDGQKPAGKLPQRHQAVLVYVDDVDAHCERARRAGAAIESEPADMFYGDRVYNARDPEGQLWYFHQHVVDVSPEEMLAAAEQMTGRPEGSAPPAKRAAKPRARAPKPSKPAPKKGPKRARADGRAKRR
jgi:uncharacterized glyoxalase superfamily protein PhnB